MKVTKGNKKPQQVQNKEEVLHFMENQENGAWMDTDGSTYYFLTVKEPDSKALDSLLDRVHGKSRQPIGLDGGEDDKPIAIKLVEDELKSWANKK